LDGFYAVSHGMTSHLGTEAESFFASQGQVEQQVRLQAQSMRREWEQEIRKTRHVRIPKVHRQIKQYHVIHKSMVPKVD